MVPRTHAISPPISSQITRQRYVPTARIPGSPLRLQLCDTRLADESEKSIDGANFQLGSTRPPTQVTRLGRQVSRVPQREGIPRILAQSEETGLCSVMSRARGWPAILTLALRAMKRTFNANGLLPRRLLEPCNRVRDSEDERMDESRPSSQRSKLTRTRLKEFASTVALAGGTLSCILNQEGGANGPREVRATVWRGTATGAPARSPMTDASPSRDRSAYSPSRAGPLGALIHEHCWDSLVGVA